MSEFEVGQPVRSTVRDVSIPKGSTGVVKQIGDHSSEFLVVFDDSGYPLWYDDDELEAVE